MKPIFYIILLALTFVSCNKKQPTEPEFSEPLQKWQSQNLHNYSVDQMLSCFCLNAGETMRVVVKADTVYRVIRLKDNTVVDYKNYITIDSLFSIISRNISDSIVVRYNDQYGYPEFLDVNPQWHPVDGGYTYLNSNLQVQ